ncbi:MULTISPECIES: DUF1822 family protein [unclassified Moorena]|uniref:DUF1822 family protein n=1 Tax=unclassified Moorena TaxID=2683338 RepID=UPI0013FE853A|nr:MULTISPECIES: DUF1822 family protein [unclassified Moorena]NEO14350.1 DUF1822 family protein [Moorena sp. SIO3E8]NEQ00361.1 DUF1822 family protein [Moorena sp. SIO3F7]
MIHNANMLADWSIPMPITLSALEIAEQFAHYQPNQQKAEQVYLNTLAVCAVNNYLRILGIPTDLTAGDSWNSVVRLAENVADLRVTGLGRLECRPVKPGDLTCPIPQEVRFNRIGYVVVEIDQDHTEATLLGFSPTSETSQLVIHQLRSLKDLPAYLDQFQPMTQLSQWLEHMFEAGWQSVETLLGNQGAEPAFAFRTKSDQTIRRCKQIEWGANQGVALVVALTPESETKLNVFLQLNPINGQTYLPPNLQLLLLDEEQEMLINAQARNQDQAIQLDFSCEPGDRFSVKVALDNASVIEEFVI